MSEDDYNIGYRKPPLWNRFQPGQSGNPKGRPKKTTVERTILDKILKEMNQTVKILENGKKIKVTKFDAMVKRVMANALQGDVKSIGLLLKIVPQLEAIQESIPQRIEVSWKS